MYEGSDTMETSPTFTKGDIVWVKLSSYWWPGEVIHEDDLPEDLLSDFKKPPLVIVKFFDEDSYEYVKNWSNIYPYTCPKKNEFIKKGMAGFRAKLSHMAKFPKDVGTAEEKTNGNPNILSQPEFLPVKKINYDEIFGTPSPKKTAKGKVSLPSSKKTPKEKYAKDSNQPHITHRRFLGNDDYRAYICIQYPGKDRQWDSDDEEIKKLNEEPEKLMSCQSCSFKTTRLEVMIMHTKMHIQGIYITSKRKPKKSKGQDISDSESEAGPTKSPKPKQRKKKEIVKPEAKDIFTNLLEEWDDTDEETETETQKKSSKPKKKSNKLVEVSSDNEKDELEDENVDQENQDTTKKALDNSHIAELSESQSSFKDTQEDIKNCFDFDEEEEEDDFLIPTSVGRKIPRVIPEKPKPTISEKSQKVEGIEKEDVAQSVDEIEKQIATMEVESGNEKDILRVSQSFNRNPDVDENIENTFKELMQETELPALDDLTQTLKPEQNFHDARTIKFPDKGGTTLKGGGTSKKKFVTSGEDLEAGFRKIEAEEVKAEKPEDLLEVKDSKTSKGTRFTQVDNQDTTHIRSDDKSTNSIKNSQDSTEVIHEKHVITPAPKSYSGRRSRARHGEVVKETAIDKLEPPKTTEDLSKQLEEHTEVLLSMDRRQTRQSQQDKKTELDESESKERIQEDAQDSRRSSRRRTKQFVIEEDSEEIIEITTGVHSDILDSTEEIIVHMDDEAKAKLAAIDSEIEELKKSLEATQSSLECSIGKSETIERAEEPTTQDKIAEPAETKVDQDTQVTDVQKKSKRKTRHTMSNVDLQINEKIKQRDQNTEPVEDITDKLERKSQRKHSKEGSIPGGDSTIKSFEEQKDSREVENLNQKEIDKVRKKSQKKHSKEESESIEDSTKKFDEKHVTTRDESIKQKESSETVDNVTDKLRRKSRRNHSKEESVLVEDAAVKTVEEPKVSTEDTCIKQKGENSGTIEGAIDEVKGKSQRKHLKEGSLPTEDKTLKSVKEQKVATEDENIRQKAEISDAVEEIMDKIKRKSQRTHSKQGSIDVESPAEHKFEDKNIKQGEGSSTAVKVVTDKIKRKNQRKHSKEEDDSAVKLVEKKLVSTKDQDVMKKEESSGVAEDITDIVKKKTKKHLKTEIGPVEELTVKSIGELKLSPEDENIRQKEVSSETVEDNADKVKRKSHRRHVKEEITPVEALIATLVGEPNVSTEGEIIRQKESSGAVEDITEKVKRKSQRIHLKGESIPAEDSTIKLVEEQKCSTDEERIRQKVGSSGAEEDTDKVKRRSQRIYLKEELTPAKDLIVESVEDQTSFAESENFKQKEENPEAVEVITDKVKRKRKHLKEETMPVTDLKVKLVEEQKGESSGTVEATDNVKRKSQRIHLKEELKSVEDLVAEMVEEPIVSAEEECTKQKEESSGAIESTDKVKRKSQRIHLKEELKSVEDLVAEMVEEQTVSAEEECIKQKEESSGAIESTDKVKRKSQRLHLKEELKSVEDLVAEMVEDQTVSTEDESIKQKEESSGALESTDKVKRKSQRLHSKEEIKPVEDFIVEPMEEQTVFAKHENIEQKEESSGASESTDKVKRKSQRLHSKEEIKPVEDLVVEPMEEQTVSAKHENIEQKEESSRAVEDITDKSKRKSRSKHLKAESMPVEDSTAKLVKEQKDENIRQKEESSEAVEATDKVKRKSQRIHSKEEIKPIKDLIVESVEEQTVSADHEHMKQKEESPGALEDITDKAKRKSQRKHLKGESTTVEDLTVELVEEQKVSTVVENIRQKEESSGPVEATDRVKRKSQRIHSKEEITPVEDLIVESVELTENKIVSAEDENIRQEEEEGSKVVVKVKRKSQRLHSKEEIEAVKDLIVESVEEQRVSADHENIKLKEECSGAVEDITDKGKRKSHRKHSKGESMSAEVSAVKLVEEQKVSTKDENIRSKEESSGLVEATDKLKRKSQRILSKEEIAPVKDVIANLVEAQKESAEAENIRPTEESFGVVEDITDNVERTIQRKQLKVGSMPVEDLTVELDEEKKVSTEDENQIKEKSGAVADTDKIKRKSQTILSKEEIVPVEDLKVEQVVEQKVSVEDNLSKTSELIPGRRRRGRSKGPQKDEENILELNEKVTQSDSNAEKLDNILEQTTNTLAVSSFVSKDSKSVPTAEEPIGKTRSKLEKHIDEVPDTAAKVTEDLKGTDNVSHLALPENLEQDKKAQDILEEQSTSDHVSRRSRSKLKKQEKREDLEKSTLKELARTDANEKISDVSPKPELPTLMESGISKSNIEIPVRKIRKSRWDQPPKEEHVVTAIIENEPKTVFAVQEPNAAAGSNSETHVSEIGKSGWKKTTEEERVASAEIKNEHNTVSTKKEYNAAAESNIETPASKIRKSRWQKSVKDECVVTAEIENVLKTVSAEQEHNVAAGSNSETHVSEFGKSRLQKSTKEERVATAEIKNEPKTVSTQVSTQLEHNVVAESNIKTPVRKIRKSRWDQPPKEEHVVTAVIENELKTVSAQQQHIIENELKTVSAQQQHNAAAGSNSETHVVTAIIENELKTVFAEQEPNAAAGSNSETHVSEIGKSRWQKSTKEERVATAEIKNEHKTVSAEQKHNADAESNIETPVPKIRKSRWQKSAKEERIVTDEIENELTTVSAEQKHNAAADLLEIVRESSQATNEIHQSPTSKTRESRTQELPNEAEDKSSSEDQLEKIVISDPVISDPGYFLSQEVSSNVEAGRSQRDSKENDKFIHQESHQELLIPETDKPVASDVHLPEKPQELKESTPATVETEIAQALCGHLEEFSPKSRRSRQRKEPEVSIPFPENKTEIQTAASTTVEVVDTKVDVTDTVLEVHTSDIVTAEIVQQQISNEKSSEIVQPQISNQANEESSPKSISGHMKEPEMAVPYSENNSVSQTATSVSLEVVDTSAAVTDTVVEVHTSDIVATEIIQPQISNEDSSPKSRRSRHRKEPENNSESSIAALASVEVVDTRAAVTDTAIDASTSEIVGKEIVEPQAVTDTAVDASTSEIVGKEIVEPQASKMESSPKSKRSKHSKHTEVAASLPEKSASQEVAPDSVGEVYHKSPLKIKLGRSSKHTKDEETIVEKDHTLKDPQLKEFSSEVSTLETAISVPQSETPETSKSKRSRARKITKGDKESAKFTLAETEAKPTWENKAYTDFALSEETYSKTRRGRSRKQTKEEEDFARAIEESLKDMAQKSKDILPASEDQVPDSKKSDSFDEMSGEHSQKGRKSRSRRFHGDVTSDQTKEEEDFARAIEASLKDMAQKSKDVPKKSEESGTKKIDSFAEMSEEHSKKGRKGRPRKYSKGAEHDSKVSKDDALSHLGDATSETLLTETLIKPVDDQKDVSETPLLHSDSRKSKIEQKPKRRKSRSHTSEQLLISTEEGTPKDLVKPEKTAAIIADSVAIETSKGHKTLDNTKDERESSDIATGCQTEPIADEQKEIVAAKLEVSETISQAEDGSSEQPSLKIKREKPRKHGKEKEHESTHTEHASSISSDDKQAEELSAALEFTKTVLELVESQQSSLESASSQAIESVNESTLSSKRRKSTTSNDGICEPNRDKPVSVEKEIDQKNEADQLSATFPEEPRKGRSRKHSKREDVVQEDVLKLQHEINESKAETVVSEDQKINLEAVGSDSTADTATKRVEAAKQITDLDLFKIDKKIHLKTKRRRSSTPAKTITDIDDDITVSQLTNYRDLEETSPKAKRGRPRKHNTEDIFSVSQNLEHEGKRITSDINLKDDVQPVVSESTSVEHTLHEKVNKITESSPFKAKRGRPRRHTKDVSLPTTQEEEQQPKQLKSTSATLEHDIEKKEDLSATLLNETDSETANLVISQAEDLSSVNLKTISQENEVADKSVIDTIPKSEEIPSKIIEENQSLNILHTPTNVHEVVDSVLDTNTQKIEDKLPDSVPLIEKVKESQDEPAVMEVAELSQQLEITADSTDKIVSDHSAEPVALVLDETEKSAICKEKESSLLTKPKEMHTTEMEVPITSLDQVDNIEKSSIPEIVTSYSSSAPELIENDSKSQSSRSDEQVSQSIFDVPVDSVSIDIGQVEIEKEIEAQSTVECDKSQNDAKNIDQFDFEANLVENTQTVVPSESEMSQHLMDCKSSGSHQELEIVEEQTDLSEVIHMEAEGILEEVVEETVSTSNEPEKVGVVDESQTTTNESDTMEHLINADETIDASRVATNVLEENKSEKDDICSNKTLFNIEENKHEEIIEEKTSIETTSEEKSTVSDSAKVSIDTSKDTEENKPVSLASVECEEMNRHVPPKKNRWPWRSSYVRIDDNTSKQQVVPCESVVKEEVVMGEQIVESNNKAVIEANTTVDKFECVVNTSEDKNVFNKTDLVESNTLGAPGTSENFLGDLNESEIILPPKKSKRLSEVKFDFLHDDFASDSLASEKKDSDNLGFPNCDDSIMSTSLRNNIEGLIKDIDSFDGSCVSDSLNKVSEADPGHDEAGKSDLALVSNKEPANVVKSVPPKKKKMEFSKPVEPKESTNNQLTGDSSKNEEKPAEAIPQPPKKKIQKLFENLQALEKLGRGNEMPLMSPLAKKKNFLFQQEELEHAQKLNEISQHSSSDTASHSLEKNISETDSLFNEKLKTLNQPIRSLDNKEGEVDVDKFFTLPKKRKKRKSSSYGEPSQKKERRPSSESAEVKQEEESKGPISSLDIIKTAGENDSITNTPVKDELITTDSPDEHKNQMEVNLEEVDFRFNIQTNLSNLATSKAEELSALASYTLSEIKNEAIEEKAGQNLTSDVHKESLETSVVPKEEIITPKEEPVVPIEPIMPEGHPSESEFVPISVTPTVMSEKDLADAQVEITTDKVISEKKPTSLGMFSMDFLDTSQPGKTIPVKVRKREMSTTKAGITLGTTKPGFTLGTEFTSKAMTKEFDNRSLTTQPKAYALKSELLDILEGNSNSSTNSSGSEQKFKTSFDNYDKQNVVQGMFDFEEAIPSQIVLSNKVNPETVLMDSPKLLERLSKSNEVSKTKKVVIQSDIKVSEGISKGLISKITKPLGTPRPGQKIIIKTSKSQPMPKPTGNKPIILSEQIIRPANALKPVQKPIAQPQGLKRQYEDIEDVETAFIIPKIAKKTTEEIVPVAVEKPPRARAKSGGKAKIIQQTIITPKGEIIQPQTSATTKTVKPMQIQAAQPQPDDTVFDINSMPIVLSDDLLTPESIQNMPVVLSEDVIPQGKPVGVKTDEKVLSTVAKKVVANVGPKQQIMFKTTPSGSSTTLPTKQATKPRILSNVSASASKIPKPSPAALLATGTSADGKPTKYVLVPSTTVTQNVPQMKTVKPPVIKKPHAAQTKVTNIQPSEPPSQVVGNKIMIVTNQHGQQTRVVLTPQQQKAFMQAQPGSKTKAIIKGAIPKALLETAAAAAAGPSGVIQKTAASSIPQGASPTVSSQGGLLMTVGKGAKTPMQPKKTTKTPAKPQKTILIKNQLGQTVRKIQGTDDADLDRQVMEQLEAIKASARLQQANKSPEIINYTNRPIPSSTTAGINRSSTLRRSYSKKVDPIKVKPTVSIPQAQIQTSTETSVPALAPLSPQPKSPQVQSQTSPNLPKQPKVEHATPIPVNSMAQQQSTGPVKTETKATPTTSGGPESKPAERPLTQLVIQDGLGNQTTITEGQILAIPSETVDGQPQSYMLVTLDEMGNITPLNNEALMSLDPSLGLGGDLNNMVLQVDQGQGTVAALRPAESSAPSVPEPAVSNIEQKKVEERLKPEPHKIVQPAMEPKHAPLEPPKSQEVPMAVEQQIVIGEGVLPGADAGGQQLIVTGDPIATQKFLESLSDGSTDLANILANAEGGSVLIQADGQQILIKTNTGNQSMLGIAESTEGGGNPIFATHKPNQDILAAALANTDVFQGSDQQAVHPSPIKGLQSSQLSPSTGAGVLYPMHVGNVLETSLTLSSPIMTPLEVPSMPSKKIDDDVDILNQVPKNVDLPITITDPSISQTVAQQQAIGLMELNHLIGEIKPPGPIDMDPFKTSLPSLDEPLVGAAQKSFNGSMPLLTEDGTEAESRESSHLGKIRVAKGLQENQSSFGTNFGSLPMLPETVESTREEVVKTSCFGEMGSLPSLSEDVIEDSGSSIGSTKHHRTSPKPIERDIVDEGLSTLGGEMCSSLSEPPPDMFDLASITGKEEEISSDVSSIPEPEGLSLHSDNSGEIPIQPPIVANLNDLKRPRDDTDGQDEKRQRTD